jgi:hypothetical protein
LQAKRRIVAALKKNIHTRRILRMIRLVLNVIKHGSYYTRVFFILPKKKALYLSVSKAGNTSIKASMFNLPKYADYRFVHRAMRTFHSCRSIEKLGQYGDYFKFTFVRNPFRRLVSCYENKLHTDKAEVGKTICFLIYDSYLFGFLSKDRGFRSFARRVCMIPDCLSDRHFASQSMDAVGPDGRLLVDYVGKLERMERDYEPLRQKFGFAPLPHYNRTKTAMRNWMDYYDLDTARRVYRRYRTDIEVFGYQDAYAELVAYLQAREGA